jgi:hypothetical protein
MSRARRELFKECAAEGYPSGVAPRPIRQMTAVRATVLRLRRATRTTRVGRSDSRSSWASAGAEQCQSIRRAALTRRRNGGIGLPPRTSAASTPRPDPGCDHSGGTGSGRPVEGPPRTRPGGRQRGVQGTLGPRDPVTAAGARLGPSVGLLRRASTFTESDVDSLYSLPPPAYPRRRVRRAAQGRTGGSARAIRGLAGNAIGDRITEYEQVIAHNLEQAYRYRAELGAAPGALAPLAARTARLLPSAHQRASEREDAVATHARLERALALGHGSSNPVEISRWLELEAPSLKDRRPRHPYSFGRERPCTRFGRADRR